MSGTKPKPLSGTINVQKQTRYATLRHGLKVLCRNSHPGNSTNAWQQLAPAAGSSSWLKWSGHVQSMDSVNLHALLYVRCSLPESDAPHLDALSVWRILGRLQVHKARVQ